MPKEEAHSKKKIELKPRIQRISMTIGIFCLAAVAASFFSFPFPFVRQIWIQEVLGVSGLLQVIVFLLILRQIEKHHSIPALLAGLGLLLNEQILSCLGFRILVIEQRVSSEQIIYFIVSAVVGIFLAALMLSVFELFCAARKTADQKTPPLFSGPIDSLRLLIPFIFIYGLLLGGIFYTNRLWTGPLQFSILKNIAWIASAASMTGVGLEINDFIDEVQTKEMCWLKAFSHGICLAAILWAIYRLISIESVIILN